MTEAFAHLPEGEAYPRMLAHVMSEIDKWKRAAEIRKAFTTGAAHVIGTSGTVTCLTGVTLGLTKYRRDKVDGAWVTRDAMLGTVQKLKEAGMAKMHKFPTIGEDRSALMLAGCAIVEGTWSLAPKGDMRVADRGLREGLLLSMMHGPKRNSRKRRKRGDNKTRPAEQGAAT
ncbi:MAG: hypothetical protein AAFR01_03565 [Pseudomonadota bacterium]